MNCSWDGIQVIYLFHSYILFLKFKRQAICRVIFIFSGQLRQHLFFFSKETHKKFILVGKKEKCFKMVSMVVSLSLINMSSLERKQKSPKQQKLPNRIKTVNGQCSFGSSVEEAGPKVWSCMREGALEKVEE